MLDLVSYGALAPPAVFVLLSLVGVLLALVWRRLGLFIALVASLCLYVAATPAFSSWLSHWIEAAIPDNPDFSGAQAIVVLGGDVRPGDAGQPDTLGPNSLERVVFAAEAYRRLRLPVAVSGGPADGSHEAAGDLMKAALERDFSIPVTWDENRSATTIQNAIDTVPLLTADRVNTVILVTQAWHMPRSLWSFGRMGLRALPWPAPRTALRASRIDDFLPRSSALQGSFYALHELIGGLYYRLRY
jgi:uncharacterized SAM-binding protein YcdF (DUF218 family)